MNPNPDVLLSLEAEMWCRIIITFAVVMTCLYAVYACMGLDIKAPWKNPLTGEFWINPKSIGWPSFAFFVAAALALIIIFILPLIES